MPANAWYEHVTIDLIAHILNRSIFHPFIAWLIPLCLRAITTPYDAPNFIAACVWASLVTLFAVVSAVNQRLAYGLPRALDWNNEVVVITGGASGLGKILAEMFGMRGASVAVLDIRIPDKEETETEALESVKYYKCDVGNAEDIERAKVEICRDVRLQSQRNQRIALPTIFSITLTVSPSSALPQS